MEKRHSASMRARYRRLVDQPESLLLQTREMRLDVRDPEADVMDAFAALLDELRHRRIGRQRLEQLEVRVADIDERGLHALRRDVLDAVDFQSECFVDFR